MSEGCESSLMFQRTYESKDPALSFPFPKKELLPSQTPKNHQTAFYETYENPSYQTHPSSAGIDWDTENKLPPWMTSITEGSQQAVAVLLGQSLPPDGSAPQVLVDRAEMAKKLLDEGLFGLLGFLMFVHGFQTFLTFF